MALDRVYDGTGAIGEPAPITLGPDGRVTEQMLQYIVSVLTEHARKINGQISLGSGAPARNLGNIDAEPVEFVTPGAPNTQFEVVHRLGRVPVGYWPVRKTAACDIYDSNSGSWTDSVLLLKATVASVTVRLIVW